jgi:hypothetical protein
MRRVSGLAVSLLVVARALSAQWSVAGEVGMLDFAGGARDTSAVDAPTTLRPARGTAYALRVERRFRAVGLGLGVRYGTVAVGAQRASTVVEEKGALTLYEAAPEVVLTLARPGAGGAVRLHVGPLIDHWTLSGGDDRTRVAAAAGLSLDWPLAGRWEAAFRADVALGPSAWVEGELPEGFARRLLWRHALAAGLALRL